MQSRHPRRARRSLRSVGFSTAHYDLHDDSVERFLFVALELGVSSCMGRFIIPFLFSYAGVKLGKLVATLPVEMEQLFSMECHHS